MISVVIPTFNRQRQLLRAVESVFSQTYQDFELIVVDDGSTQNLQAIAELVRDNGHQFVRTENMGVAAARNYGVSLSRGTWITFLDSDDKWKPRKLERQITFHAENPDYLISQCDETWIRRGKRVNKKKYQAMPSGEAFFQSLRLCCISPSAVMMHRDLFKDKGGFDRRFVVCEDYDLWLRITADYSIGCIPEEDVEKYGGHDDQLSRSQAAMDRFRIFALLKLLMRFDLESGQVNATLHEIARKAEILYKGAVKRNLPQKSLFRDLVDVAIDARSYADTIQIARPKLEPVYEPFKKVALSKSYPTVIA